MFIPGASAGNVTLDGEQVVMRKMVYNLEFPPWCPEMIITGYRFIRVKEYEEKLARLHHTSDSGVEFFIATNPGQHAVTSYVEIPAAEEKSVLPWSDQESTIALDDILLLLSIFTRRDVFAVDDTSPDEASDLWTADSRLHIDGGILRSSIPYREQVTVDGEVYDIGFQEGVTRVYSLIRDEEWRRKYASGYFLFLALHAFKCDLLEAAVGQCCVMWEHLFSLHDRGRLLRDENDGTDYLARLIFLLAEYDLAEQVGGDERTERLSYLRDTIVHFGRIPEEAESQREALFFLRLTEVLLAQILGLSPPNVLGTQGPWEKPSGPSQVGRLPVFGVRSGCI